MTTLYNRRRGAKARAPRGPRRCRRTVVATNDQGMEVLALCRRNALVNRYCEEHQVPAAGRGG